MSSKSSRPAQKQSVESVIRDALISNLRAKGPLADMPKITIRSSSCIRFDVNRGVDNALDIHVNVACAGVDCESCSGKNNEFNGAVLPESNLIDDGESPVVGDSGSASGGSFGAEDVFHG